MANRSETLTKMLDLLWSRYKTRVPYAAQYQRMVEERGGKVQNDHVAFRTFNCEMPGQPSGVAAIARVLEPLGYQQKDRYVFEDKKLTAWHWEHAANPSHPKIFISQLEVDQLTPESAKLICDALADTKDLLSPHALAQLASLSGDAGLDPVATDSLATQLAGFFARPWSPPKRQTVMRLNAESQYAAWTLLHGNAVNHFTAYINEQNVKDWPDLEATVAALRAAGLPMKSELEGGRGSKLRQSSTLAVDMECEITEDNGSRGHMPWSYAYYELAERGQVPGPDGKPVRFQAFLGAQATNLFEMTRRD